MWGSWIAITSDYTILSLSIIEFIANYFNVIQPLIDWVYTWLWNELLDLLLSLPLVISQTFKAVFSTWLGLWILKQIRNMKPQLAGNELKRNVHS